MEGAGASLWRVGSGCGSDALYATLYAGGGGGCGGTGDDALYDTLYAGGCGGQALFAGGVERAGR